MPDNQDRYAVFGYPVSHSLSPKIHRHFALQEEQALTYEAIEAAPGMLKDALQSFADSGGLGCNITVPHKADAARLARDAATALGAGIIVGRHDLLIEGRPPPPSAPACPRPQENVASRTARALL